MIIEKCLSGGYVIYAMDKSGHLFRMRYMDYTKTEAVRMFRADLKSHNGTI